MCGFLPRALKWKRSSTNSRTAGYASIRHKHDFVNFFRSDTGIRERLLA